MTTDPIWVVVEPNVLVAAHVTLGAEGRIMTPRVFFDWTDSL